MDPVVKRERVLLDGAAIVDRKGQSVTLQDVDGRPVITLVGYSSTSRALGLLVVT